MSHVGYPWYAGQIDSVSAFSKLGRKNDGDFLVRKCQSHDLHMLHIRASAVSSGVRSFKIAQTKSEESGSQGTFFIEKGRNFPSLEALINNAKRSGLRGTKLRMPFTEAGDTDAESIAEADKQRKISSGCTPTESIAEPKFDADDSMYINNAQARSLSVSSRPAAPRSGSARSRASSEFQRPAASPPMPMRGSNSSSLSSASRSSLDSPPIAPAPARDAIPWGTPETAGDDAESLPDEEEGDYGVMEHNNNPAHDAAAATLSAKSAPKNGSHPPLPPELPDDTYEVVAEIVRQPDYEKMPADEAASDSDDDNLPTPTLPRNSAYANRPPPLPGSDRPSARPHEDEGEFEETYETVSRNGVGNAETNAGADDDEEYAVVPALRQSVRNSVAPATRTAASAPPPNLPPPRHARGHDAPDSTRERDPKGLEMVEEYAAVNSDDFSQSRLPLLPSSKSQGLNPDDPPDLDDDLDMVDFDMVEEYEVVDPHGMRQPPRPPRETGSTPSQPPPLAARNVEHSPHSSPRTPKALPSNVKGGNEIPSSESTGSATTGLPALSATEPGMKEQTEKQASVSPRSGLRPESTISSGYVQEDPYDLGDNHQPDVCADAEPETTTPESDEPLYPLATNETLSKESPSTEKAAFAAFAAKLEATLGEPSSTAGDHDKSGIEGLSKLNTLGRNKVRLIQDENEMLKEKLKQAEEALAVVARAQAAGSSTAGSAAPPVPAPPPPPLPPAEAAAPTGLPSVSMLTGAKLKKTAPRGSITKSVPKSAFEQELAKRAAKQRKAIRAQHGDSIYAKAQMPDIAAAKAAKAERDAQREEARKREILAKAELEADEAAPQTKPPWAKPWGAKRPVEIPTGKQPPSKVDPVTNGQDDGEDLGDLDFLLSEPEPPDASSGGAAPSSTPADVIVDDTYDVTESRGPHDVTDAEYAAMANQVDPEPNAAHGDGPSRESSDEAYEVMPPHPIDPHRREAPLLEPRSAADSKHSVPDVSAADSDSTYGNVEPSSSGCRSSAMEVYDDMIDSTSARPPPPVIARKKDAAALSGTDESGQPPGAYEEIDEKNPGVESEINDAGDSSDEEHSLAQSGTSASTMDAVEPNPDYDHRHDDFTEDLIDETYDVAEHESAKSESPRQSTTDSALPPKPYVNEIDMSANAKDFVADTAAVGNRDGAFQSTPPPRPSSYVNTAKDAEKHNPELGEITEDTYDVMAPEASRGAAHGIEEEVYDVMERPDDVAAPGNSTDETYDVMETDTSRDAGKTGSEDSQAPDLSRIQEDSLYDDADNDEAQKSNPQTKSTAVDGSDPESGARHRNNPRANRSNGRAATMATTLILKGKFGVVFPGKVSPKVHAVHLSGNSEIPGCGKIELYEKGDNASRKLAKHTIRVKHICVLDVQPHGKKKFALLIVERRSSGDNRYCLVSADEPELIAWRSAIEDEGAAVDGDTLYDAVTSSEKSSASPNPSRSPNASVSPTSGPGEAGHSASLLNTGEHQQDYLMFDTGRWRNPLQRRYFVLVVTDDGNAMLLHYDDDTRKREPREFPLGATTTVRSFIPKGGTSTKGAKGVQEIGLTLKTGRDELKLRCLDPWSRKLWQDLIEKACGRDPGDPAKGASDLPSDRRRIGSVSLDRGDRMRGESTSEGTIALSQVTEDSEHGTDQ